MMGTARRDGEREVKLRREKTNEVEAGRSE